MQTVSLDDLRLDAAHLEGDPSASWLASFPFTRDAPGETETESESLSVVYNELDPEARIGTHRDGTDEALLVLEGTLEASVGEETGSLGAGDLALIPADTRHSVRNVGQETARMVGFFGRGRVDSTFEGTVVSESPR